MKQSPYKKRLLPKKICNAIVHRDYMGVHTQMKVYDDCIMLWNDGKLKRCSLSNGTSTILSSHIHMKVCTPPYHSVSDLFLWGQPLTWDNVFCILSFIRYVSITIV